MDELEACKKLYDERFERDKERLNKLEKLTEEVSKCSIRLSEMVENDRKDIEDHERRIDAIEHKPSDMWDKIISGIIAAVVAFLVGGILH